MNSYFFFFFTGIVFCRDNFLHCIFNSAMFWTCDVLTAHQCLTVAELCLQSQVLLIVRLLPSVASVTFAGHVSNLLQRLSLQQSVEFSFSIFIYRTAFKIRIFHVLSFYAFNSLDRIWEIIFLKYYFFLSLYLFP